MNGPVFQGPGVTYLLIERILVLLRILAPLRIKFRPFRPSTDLRVKEWKRHSIC